MNVPKKIAALAAGFAAALAITVGGHPSSAQNPSASGAQTLVIDEATIDWIERSNVAALREGVIEKMELDIGMPVAAGKPIGYLHAELAKLGVKKAEVASNSVGPKAKAQAQKELAAAVVAINQRLAARGKNLVSYEEMQKAEAELKVAQAMIVEAEEKSELDKAELALAERALEEHTIKAPFDGIVIERIKHPGESVRANEAVVRLGNLSRLRAYFYVPLEYSYRVKEGQIIEFQPKLGDRNAVPNPIEKKRFRGKVTFVDPQLQAIAETARRVYAELENKDLELSPGLKGVVTIYLDSTPAAPPSPTVGARTDATGVGR